jgi:hypothetical protein
MITRKSQISYLLPILSYITISTFVFHKIYFQRFSG